LTGRKDKDILANNCTAKEAIMDPITDEKTEDLAAIRKMMEEQKAAKLKKDKLAAASTIANFAIWVGVIIIAIALLLAFWK
jgi:hypothetical protein